MYINLKLNDESVETLFISIKYLLCLIFSSYKTFQILYPCVITRLFQIYVYKYYMVYPP